MGIKDKLLNLFWIEEEDDDIPVHRNEVQSRLSVAGINYGTSPKVLVYEIVQFEEAQGLVDHLKNNKQVILSCKNTLPETSQKIIDFISGAIYVLNGQCQQLDQNVFIFAPASIEITKDIRNSFGENEIGRFETYRK